jgi:hypothetical protein
MKRTLLLVLVFCGFASLACAATITIKGGITQSTADFTGPAVNDPSLNNIVDGDAFSVTVSFSGQINSPGTYDLTGGSVTFADPSALATEDAFGSISLTVSTNGSFDDISMLACLSTGSSCSGGNQLDANFEILATMLHSLNSAATGLDPPHPLDLLEDDGTTDIQGSINNYSYSNSSAVPEPASMALVACVLAVLIQIKKKENDL